MAERLVSERCAICGYAIVLGQMAKQHEDMHYSATGHDEFEFTYEKIEKGRRGFSDVKTNRTTRKKIDGVQGELL